MQAVVATVFRVLLFPHEGRIVTIDQLSFSRPDPALGASTVPTGLFKEFRDVFAWSYEAIPDIDPQSVDHGLPLFFFKLSLRPKRNIRRDCIYAFRSRPD
jgi:hypothetical protein